MYAQNPAQETVERLCQNDFFCSRVLKMKKNRVKCAFSIAIFAKMSRIVAHTLHLHT